MSAPANAITLFEEARTQWVMPDSAESIQALCIPVECCCGFGGQLGDLLCDPDDDTTNNFWCPYCQTKGWVFV